MAAYIKVARIVKVRKRQGRLVVECCDGLPFLLEEGMTVHIVPPSLDIPRTVRIADASDEGEFSVSFEGMREYAQLVDYVGRYCLVARDDIDADLLQSSPLAVAGFSVIDGRFGDLGRVTEVLENDFQATLVVEGGFGEVMIPLVDEFVLDVDPDGGIIRTRVPDGLVEG